VACRTPANFAASVGELGAAALREARPPAVGGEARPASGGSELRARRRSRRRDAGSHGRGWDAWAAPASARRAGARGGGQRVERGSATGRGPPVAAAGAGSNSFIRSTCVKEIIR